MIEVLKPGLLTTIQDIGRFGYQQYGMVVGGAVDSKAYRIGNVLVGNPSNAASIEVTMMGPVLRALDEMVIAVTGANLEPHLDGVRISLWKTYTWKKESILEFKGSQEGIRSYVAIAGGVNVPRVMGSRSTYIPSKIGGFSGRGLEKGDVLRVEKRGFPLFQRHLTPALIPTYPERKKLRVVLGPHHSSFTEKGVGTFLSTPYTVTNQLNRMGVRLTGESIKHRYNADIPSQAVVFGTIQVASDGQPMGMLADRQTTGGYTQIATVITADHGLLAQLRPGEMVWFQEVSLKEAQERLKESQSFIRQLGILSTYQSTN